MGPKAAESTGYLPKYLTVPQQQAVFLGWRMLVLSF